MSLLCSGKLAIDATHGTNNSALNLYAVLAEHDGTGVPLAYLFVGNARDASPVDSAIGAATNIFEPFLRGLQSVNSQLNPTFFGCDKDFSEINAIRQVYPSVTIQLCYWHAKRAIRQKLQSAVRTKIQASYRPGESHLFFPSLEVCWGSTPAVRPQGPHQLGTCACISKSSPPLDPTGRVETGQYHGAKPGLGNL